ncbi:rust resistance kinase Lr10-like [Brachypodium distachyon]|uniref:rust resistance kinase Lr10-like n=1 Tax=Brachypodium distachyon TaxID=15368 RepID=UPI00071D69A6|nr:rust resistance kinase Lr10-like [Brachypodium distachyon]|eukprot:XP_014756311.1 rust resistance kinase Lr10-like [Brachypodium distachyon]
MRRAIAIGVTIGLCYLHHGRNHSIVHYNINSTNILLDTGFKPKIAGFDLARINLAGNDQPVPIWELPAVNIVSYTAPG